MTKKEFKAQMLALKERWQDDPEVFHSEADDLMCWLLTKLGYGEGVEIFENAENGIRKEK